MKGTDEQTDEETRKVRSGRIPSIGASVSVELGCVTLLVGMCSPTCKFSEPYTLGDFMGFLHIGAFLHIGTVSLFLLSGEIRVGGGLNILFFLRHVYSVSRSDC